MKCRIKRYWQKAVGWTETAFVFVFVTCVLAFVFGVVVLILDSLHLAGQPFSNIVMLLVTFFGLFGSVMIYFGFSLGSNGSEEPTATPCRNGA